MVTKENMQHQSKLEESIKILRKLGWKIRLLPNGIYEAYWSTTSPQYDRFHIYTKRGLIKLAKSYGKNSRQNTAVSQNTKDQSKRERAFVRDQLLKFREEGDINFPKQRFSDRWNWD